MEGTFNLSINISSPEATRQLRQDNGQTGELIFLIGEGMAKVCGIYEIVNTVNGHRYIGSSIDTWNRWLHHRRSLELGKHHSRYLQNAWNKYGSDAFEFRVVLICDRRNLNLYEQLYMDLYVYKYNKNKNATGAGKILSIDTRNKLKYANIGKIYSDEYKRNMSISLRNRVLSPQAIENIRVGTIKSNQNRVWSEESKQKDRLAHIGKKPWLGKHHTEETKQKLKIISARQIHVAQYWSGTMVSPMGIEYKNIYNLAAFCRAHNLCDSGMYMVAYGKRSSYKGWTYINETTK